MQEEKFVKTVSARDARAQFSKLINGKEAVLVRCNGKPTAVIYPLGGATVLPMDVRRQLFLEASAKVANQLDAKGITEAELMRDFEDFKKRRRERRP